MVTAVKTVSQIATHMGIAFTIMYAMTGSIAFGGLAALLEPVCNVVLLPLHVALWKRMRTVMRGIIPATPTYATTLAERVSQALLHMAVAFAVVYWASGSLASGGLAAILEPICNVIVLPFHDAFWERVRRRIEPSGREAVCSA